MCRWGSTQQCRRARRCEDASPPVELGAHDALRADFGDLPHGSSGKPSGHPRRHGSVHREPVEAQTPTHARRDEPSARPELDGAGHDPTRPTHLN
jgi:hypothetical protein